MSMIFNDLTIIALIHTHLYFMYYYYICVFTFLIPYHSRGPQFENTPDLEKLQSLILILLNRIFLDDENNTSTSICCVLFHLECHFYNCSSTTNNRNVLCWVLEWHSANVLHHLSEFLFLGEVYNFWMLKYFFLTHRYMKSESKPK